MVYGILDALIKQPLIESEQKFIERKGYWVVSLNRWTKKSLADSFLGEKTVHGREPMPKTKTDWLKLKVFSPAWSCIDSIPKEIGHLVNLEDISFLHSEIYEIPNVVYSLKKLKKLRLQNSRISHISPEIKNLHSLEILDISSPNIRELPSELFTLKNLKELHLSSSSISNLPMEIQNLTSLEVLDVSLCLKLESLPIELEQLPNLKRISVFSFNYPVDHLIKCLPNKAHLFDI